MQGAASGFIKVHKATPGWTYREYEMLSEPQRAAKITPRRFLNINIQISIDPVKSGQDSAAFWVIQKAQHRQQNPKMGF